MAFEKITDSEIATYGVQSQPNKLTGSALTNKKVFDNLIDAVVQEKFNALIDELTAPTAAGQIGVSVTGLSAATVGAALQALLAAMQDITQGSVAPGSIGATELAAELEIGDRFVNVLPAHVGIKMGTTVPTTADIGVGEIYLKYEEE